MRLTFLVLLLVLPAAPNANLTTAAQATSGAAGTSAVPWTGDSSSSYSSTAQSAAVVAGALIGGLLFIAGAVVIGFFVWRRRLRLRRQRIDDAAPQTARSASKFSPVASLSLPPHPAPSPAPDPMELPLLPKPELVGKAGGPQAPSPSPSITSVSSSVLEVPTGNEGSLSPSSKRAPLPRILSSGMSGVPSPRVPRRVMVYGHGQKSLDNASLREMFETIRFKYSDEGRRERLLQKEADEALLQMSGSFSATGIAVLPGSAASARFTRIPARHLMADSVPAIAAFQQAEDLAAFTIQKAWRGKQRDTRADDARAGPRKSSSTPSFVLPDTTQLSLLSPVGLQISTMEKLASILQSAARRASDRCDARPATVQAAKTSIVEQQTSVSELLDGLVRQQRLMQLLLASLGQVLSGTRRGSHALKLRSIQALVMKVFVRLQGEQLRLAAFVPELDSAALMPHAGPDTPNAVHVDAIARATNELSSLKLALIDLVAQLGKLTEALQTVMH